MWLIQKRPCRRGRLKFCKLLQLTYGKSICLREKIIFIRFSHDYLMKIVALEYRRAIGLFARFIREESKRVIGIRLSPFGLRPAR